MSRSISTDLDDRDPFGDEIARRGVPLVVVLSITAVLLAIVVGGWARIRSAIDLEARDSVAQIIDAAVAGAERGLEAWAADQRSNATWWASDPRLVVLTEQLLAVPRTKDALLAAESQEETRNLLVPVLDAWDYRGFFLISPDGISLASTRDANTGTLNLVAADQPERFSRLLAGESTVTAPQFTDVPLEGENGTLVTDAPTMFVGAPIRAADGSVLAVLTFRIDPGTTFADVLNRRRIGNTGELIAFDRQARLLNASRFEDHLVETGLVASTSFRTLVLRDAGRDLRELGWQGTSAGWPLTVMAQSAIAGDGGLDLEGYRSYLGYEVVGGWRWIDDLELGIAFEQEEAEALAFLWPTDSALNRSAVTVAVLILGLTGLLLWNRRRMRKAAGLIADQARRLRSIIDHASDAVVILDQQERIVLFNEAAATLFGYGSAEVYNRQIGLLIPPHDGAPTTDYESLKTRVLGETRRRIWYGNARRRDGSLFPAAISIGTVDLEAGRGVVVASIRDETMSVEARLRLERSNQDLEHFASVAAHDLQEPLRKVRAFGDMLVHAAGTSLDEQSGTYVKKMQDAAARMQGLIDDLLTYSRVTTKAAPNEPVDLNQTMREVITSLETLLDDNHATIDVGPLPTIEAEPTQMHQLLQNLMSNAVKYRTPDTDPEIRVAANGASNGKVTITVTDNGIGFDPAYSDRIFAIFERLHGRDQYAGTGIGLALCRKIVERHHGTITADSTLGHGSTFTVTLPATHQREGAEDAY